MMGLQDSKIKFKSPSLLQQPITTCTRQSGNFLSRGHICLSTKVIKMEQGKESVRRASVTRFENLHVWRRDQVPNASMIQPGN